MKIWQTCEEDTVILHLSGHLGVGEGILALRAAVRQAMATGMSGLVLDLSGVGYLDAAGIGALIATQRVAFRAGHRVVLTGLRTRVRDILGLARVDGVLDCARDQDTALAQIHQAPVAGPALPGNSRRDGVGVLLKPTLV
jgi:anti-sigma B factor antagonist